VLCRFVGACRCRLSSALDREETCPESANIAADMPVAWSQESDIAVTVDDASTTGGSISGGSASCIESAPTRACPCFQVCTG
jgi:hypothetical protein